MEFKELPIDPRYKVSRTGVILGLKGVPLKQATDSRGYKFVTLNNNYKQYHLSMHRAVALTFLPNPQNYPEVNHKDENKINNNVDNLEWCSTKYNSHYSRGKTVLKIDRYTGKVLAEFPAIREAARSINKSAYSPIQKCCNNLPKYNTAYGFRWQFK